MAIVKINLTHTDKKPQTTIISVNGVELVEVNTFASKLRFCQHKLTKSGGKSNSGEYWFEVDDIFHSATTGL